MVQNDEKHPPGVDRKKTSPAAFLAAAARAGLFPQTPPNISPGASLASLGLFHARDYRIRHARMEDLAVLEDLERRCWSQALQTPGDELAHRLDTFPEGQFVLVLDNTITGVIYSQRIPHADALRGARSDSVSMLHQAQGPVAQLLAVNIDPQYQERQLGDQLLEFILQYFSVTPGIESVVAVTLCRNYHRQKEMDKNPPLGLEQYIKKRDARGLLHDPILRFHELHGADISGLIPGYRPKDTKNEGFGVLAIYDIRKRRRKEANLSLPSKTNTGLSGKELMDFLEHTIKEILGKENEPAFSANRPFMEMGLDSADLLQLNEQLSHAFHQKLGATFFFKHNTHQKLVSWFQANPPAKTRPYSSLETAATAPTHNPRQNDIAIVGMACRLPGGINDPQALWELLKNGRHVIGPMPRGRWTWPAGIDPAHEHRGIDQGGFLEDIESFDASFFRISPKEAALMDPQQRILLELAWETLNNGGLSVESQAGSRTGVFIGASGSDYRLLLEQEKIPAQAHMTTGNSMAVMANRISYFFDFNGPNLSIDTACSSSLVAVHEAVQSLRQGQCTQALAGGINLICHPGTSISYYKAGMLSPDGLCRTFDQKANGYVRSEGAAMIMLKPLDRAIADQNFIHAVIKGSACNHGGLATGLTVPNPDQQARLLRDAWENAGICATSLGYFEAHGTGTSLGDPIEVQGLQDAFAQIAQSTGSQSLDIVHEKSCGLGSVKTNLGHLEAASGITGLIKTVLCLNRRELVPSLHCEKLNPHIDLADSPFYVPDRLQPWPEPKGESCGRVAGVSSFGFGGTNAHVVLEEFVGPAVETPENTRKKPSPFNRKPHWFSRRPTVTEKSSPVFFMEKGWRSVPLHTSGTKPQDAGGKIAIFSTDDTRNLAESLAKHLPQSQIVSLDDPTAPSLDFGGCIHLYGHNTNNDLDHLKLRIQWLQQWIGKGVGTRARGSNAKLTLLGVTQGLESFRNPAPNLSGAPIAALYRTLQSEYSHVCSRHMDILPGGSQDTHTLAGMIAGEFWDKQGPPEICLRDGERYAPILRACPEKPAPGPALEIPENEVLWITGGTRGLGLLCARHFVSRYNVKRLVLTGQEPFPPREQWPSFQAENGSASPNLKTALAMVQKIEAVKALEAQGVQVRVLSFTLSDEAAMGKYLQEIRQTMGPAAGVIHCAGIEGTDTPAFIRKDPEEIHRVLEPKIPGLNQLVAHFNAEPLRFFLVFSSVSAAIPALAVGRIDYAMANAYMDYLAQSCPHSCPLVSIQWPSWKETGMGEVRNPVYEGTGLVSLTDREGLRILDHVLGHDLGPVIMPAMVNPSLWEPECLLDHKPHPAPTAHAGAPRLNSGPNRKPNPKSLRPWLTRLFSRELGIEPGDVDPDTQFKDYGADSILLSQVLGHINKKLDPP
ncbi:GNAT family N-acetyltransferase [Desulfobacter sp.]|uniref:GNAT family N-acetyltransferase n=1 Tax=Desulfobacter sp. TaxID=2294 RepID=UPI003D0A5461